MVKHKPPSRIRYEKSHPTISFRLDLDTKTRLKEVLERESFASFIKEALGVREREKMPINKAHKIGYEKGYHAGYEEAKNKFIVQAPCTICNETIVVDREEEKKELAQFMRSRGWCHLSCMETQRWFRR